MIQTIATNFGSLTVVSVVSDFGNCLNIVCTNIAKLNVDRIIFLSWWFEMEIITLKWLLSKLVIEEREMSLRFSSSFQRDKSHFPSFRSSDINLLDASVRLESICCDESLVVEVTLSRTRTWVNSIESLINWWLSSALWCTFSACSEIFWISVCSPPGHFLVARSWRVNIRLEREIVLSIWSPRPWRISF